MQNPSFLSIPSTPHPPATKGFLQASTITGPSTHHHSRRPSTPTPPQVAARRRSQFKARHLAHRCFVLGARIAPDGFDEIMEDEDDEEDDDAICMTSSFEGLWRMRLEKTSIHTESRTLMKSAPPSTPTWKMLRSGNTNSLVGTLSYRLRSGILILNAASGLSSSSQPPEQLTPVDLDDEELDAYAEECARRAALADFEDIPQDELFSLSDVEELVEPRSHEGHDEDVEMLH
ncbi:hypothetical protein LshimejAT787_0601480 [Lyophyllum shimeji]|uniref:Uncharacterized protein n=1 Tax=Lyophyllum shimeji TaxID=47721 RepID=A0A9P3PPF1_LYOSH|nr:hypothetical protein LshimejAT787_0601480 [Lyophyllum shimeji]